MELVIDPRGTIRTIYTEEFDLASLGPVEIRRASHVEPDDTVRWWVDLSPISGPMLGPFARRSLALQAETGWITAELIRVPPAPIVGNGHARRPKGGRSLKGRR